MYPRIVPALVPALAASPDPFYIWAFPSDLYENEAVWCVPPWGLRGPGFRPGEIVRAPRDAARGLRWWGAGKVWAYASPEAAAAAAAAEPDALGMAHRRPAECRVLRVELLGAPGEGPLPLADGRVLAPAMRIARFCV